MAGNGNIDLRMLISKSLQVETSLIFLAIIRPMVAITDFYKQMTQCFGKLIHKP